MSAIIFTWSQGFLNQTSSSSGSPQGDQNQAAQSNITIVAATFNVDQASATIIVRNVGAVSVSIGLMVTSGTSSNAGFTGSVINSTFTSAAENIEKGHAVTLQTGSSLISESNSLTAGDILTFKVTTTAGTFAQATYTVP
jgi:hypothetical protein